MSSVYKTPSSDDLFGTASFGGGGGGGGGGGVSRSIRGTTPSYLGAPPSQHQSATKSIAEIVKDMNDPNQNPKINGDGDAYSGDHNYGDWDGR